MANENAPQSTPAQWLERIRTLRAKDDFKGALEECKKGLEAVPDSPDLLLAYGELRVDSFNHSKNAEHLKAALISFEKLLKLNPHHYMANLLAARIYFKGKSYDRAEDKLADILKTSPGDPRAMELKAAIQKLQSPAKEATPPEADETHISTDGIAADSIIPEHENLINRLSIFSKLDGVRSLHLVDIAGTEIKTIVKSGAPVKNIPLRVAEVFKAAAQCSRHGGLGNFQRGVLLTPGGDLMLVNVFYGILVIVMEADADLRAVEARVNRYVEALVE
ncbi:MAG: tetratricopeptide repeat protein [Nitrospinae bacterium]|nr:tetratricopeptide repeat protein [Nitrospinota bacterium]